VATLRTLIAEHEGVRPECIYVSEGSAELLKLAAIIHGAPGRQIIAARPTFPMLPQYAERLGATIVWVDVNERFGHDLEAMKAQVGQATSLIYVCNPNNPTGALADPLELRAFIHALSRQALIVVDEAYIDFAPDPARTSVIDQVKAGENILVTRTFSKLYGLAGLRIGYGVGSIDVIRRLESLRISFPNRAGVTAARASVADVSFRALIRGKVAESVAITTSVFDDHGIRYVPTHANFMMFETGRPAAQFVSFARQRGVMVASVVEPFDRWSRVSMGRPDDMRVFARVLDAFVDEA
jgi:histidinol-phosphate aminotransferase